MTDSRGATACASRWFFLTSVLKSQVGKLCDERLDRNNTEPETTGRRDETPADHCALRYPDTRLVIRAASPAAPPQKLTARGGGSTPP